MATKFVSILGIVVLGLVTSVPLASTEPDKRDGPETVQYPGIVLASAPVLPRVSRAVRDIVPSPITRIGEGININPIRNPGEGSPDLGQTGTHTSDFDPLVMLSRISTGTTPAPLFTFEGQGTDGYTPPDTVGDVGPNHYVQMVNVSFRIFDKSGNPVSADTNFTDLFAGSGLAACSNENDGDPIVLYDSLADRWLLSQFAVSTGTRMCIAISQTPDPTGSYWLYQFDLPDFPDYPKFGIWPDAYYLGTNTGYPNTYYAYAFDRMAMLAGAPATYQYSTGHPNFLMPADLDGTAAPPAGSPGFFYTMLDDSYPNHPPGVDRLALYEFDVDWATPANSTFTLAQEIPLAPFNYTVCGFFVGNCIPQPGTAQKIDSLSYWPMFRFAYRNFGSHEAVVGAFTVDTDGTDHAGIRWFELHRAGALWSKYQEGTHAPDEHHRFNESIAMDGSGNIALGYSISSSTQIANIRYAVHQVGDPLGTLRDEATLHASTGVHTASYRWGDYSSLTVDPTDDCTFWYTNQYDIANNSGFDWHTRIGVFEVPGCGGPTYTLTPAPQQLSLCSPADALYNIDVNFLDGFNEAVLLSPTGYPAGTTAGFSVNPVTPAPPTDSLLTISNTGAAAPGQYVIDIYGLSLGGSALVKSTSVLLDLFGGVPPAASLTDPADGTHGVATQPTFTWSVVTGAEEYFIEISTDPAFSVVVDSATVAGTSYTPTISLNNITTYYWRVTAANACGDGNTSAAFSFTTENVICSHPGLAVPDGNAVGVDDSLVVGSGGTLQDLDIDIVAAHTWVGDLRFILTHEDTGTSVTIFDRPGVPATTYGCAGNDVDVTLDDEATSPVEDQCGSGTPTIDGTFSPNNPLSAFDGEDLAGTWIINASDHVTADTGTLVTWCLRPTTAPVVINCDGPDVFLDGETIPAGETVTCNVGDIHLSNTQVDGHLIINQTGRMYGNPIIKVNANGSLRVNQVP